MMRAASTKLLSTYRSIRVAYDICGSFSVTTYRKAMMASKSVMVTPARSASPVSMAYDVTKLPCRMKRGKTTLKNQFHGRRRTRIWMSMKGYLKREVIKVDHQERQSRGT